MTRCLLAWLIFSCLVSNAQGVTTLIGARTAGCGNIGSVLADEGSFFGNVGALASVTHRSIFFAYELQSQLPGANRAACSLLVPFKSGTAGLGFFRFGDELYNEQFAAAGWSHKLGLTSLGAKAGLVQYSAQGYGTRTLLSLGFGGLTQITPQICVGAYALNIPAGSPTENPLPTVLVAGIGFKPDNHVFVGTEIEKGLDHPATWRTGIEYAIHKKLFVRTGFILNPNAGCFGFGGRAKRLQVDYAVKVNVALGAAHQVSCVFRLAENTKK